MKRSRYSETQIVRILKEVEAGKPVKEVCRGSVPSSLQEHVNNFSILFDRLPTVVLFTTDLN